MATKKPLYRLTVYKSRAEDPTETTVMTPVAGAPHTDSFIVTSLQGIAGSKPYLGIPKGRQGSIDVITKRSTTGNLSLSVFDTRVTAGGTNADRWSTAFIGDALGRTRLKGCRFVLERSFDGGATWANYFVGRIRHASVNRPLWLDLDLVDYADDLTRKVFVGAPDPAVASYAATAALVPIGIPQKFADFAISPRLTGSLGGIVADFAAITLDAAQDAMLALVTKTANDAVRGAAPVIVWVKNVAAGTVSYYQLITRLSQPEAFIPGSDAKHLRYTTLYITPLPPTDPRYAALPGATTAVECYLLVDAAASKELPILVDWVHPIQFAADLVDGKFSRYPGNGTARPLGTRNTAGGGSWATLLADASFGLDRYVVDAAEKGSDYLEKVIAQRHNVLFYVDQATGLVEVLDLRRTNALAGALTLTDDDLVAEIDPTWDDSRDGAITGVNYAYYVDRSIARTELEQKSDAYPALSPTMIESVKSGFFVPNDLSTLRDVGERIIEIDCRGSRIQLATFDSATGETLAESLKADLRAASRQLLGPFANGTSKATASYRLAGGAAAVKKGTYVIVQHTKLPDPATNRRGGARLMLCLSRDEDSARIAIEWLDCGDSAVALAPTITGIAVVAAGGSANTAVDVAVTLNVAFDLAEVWTCITSTAIAVRPAVNDAGWTLAGDPLQASGTRRAEPLPSGQRIWARARSQGRGAALKIPSGWAYPAGAGYVDLTAKGAPSAAAATNLFANRADITWTVGVASLGLELFLVAGAVPAAWTPAMRVEDLAAGTIKRRVGNLAASTQYTVGVRHREDTGGVSSMATVTFVTTAVLGVAPRPAGIAIASGGLA